MRKFDSNDLLESGNARILQWSRIYKDAEISLIKSSAPEIKAFLQCSRIYKDAEMSSVTIRRTGFKSFLQWSRIYKDAEIYVLILSE